MNWLVVLDPLDGLVSRTDTSLALMRQARSQQITVDTATIEALFFADRAAARVTGSDGAVSIRALQDYDLILMRKEPPYDLAFHYATQLLSLADTVVVNSPAALRDFNEKLITLPFAHYMPQTLVSSDVELILAFIAERTTCVIKSLDSFQGKSVLKIRADQTDVVHSFTAGGTQPVMVQEFLPAVADGDKRVILLGERFLGAAMRRPLQGYHANFANSEALRSRLTSREEEIIAAVGPWLLQHGIHFSGLDFIDNKLTEINITCPTGIVQISELEERNLAAEIVDYLINLSS